MVLTSLVVLFLLAVILHELGHAYALADCGVKVERISLLGFPGLITIRLPIKLKKFPGTEWVIHPVVLLGAYVKAAKGEEEKLSAADMRYFAAMGPLMNFILATTFAGFLYATDAYMYASEGLAWQNSAIKSVAFFCSVPTLWRMRRICGQYELLVVGFAGAAFMVYLFTHFSLFEIVGGPVTIGQALHAKSVELATLSVARQIANVFYLGVMLNLLLGAANLMPLYPLDGGHILRTMLKPRLSPRLLGFYDRLGFVCVMGLMVLALANDASRLWNFIASLVHLT
jgi:membrane-associated protease RseP (regulator of RpoE activity)